MKTLVLYYSKTGNTKHIAEIIAKEVKADILEIQREKDIKGTGFGMYMKGGFEAMTKRKAKIKPFEKDLQKYDLIFLGSPVWAWSMNPAVRSMLTEVNFTGKKFALYCSCSGEGSGLKVCEKTKEYLTENTVIGETEFIDPLTNNTEEQTTRAKEWAKEMRKEAKRK